MQERGIDYYGEGEGGCCLLCPDAHPECLCYNCKCTKCFWYTSPQDWDGEHGHCDKTDDLKEGKKEEAKLKYQILQEEANEKWRKDSNIVEVNNKKILTQLKEKGEVENTYTCRKCGRNFAELEEKKIFVEKSPVCILCEENV